MPTGSNPALTARTAHDPLRFHCTIYDKLQHQSGAVQLDDVQEQRKLVAIVVCDGHEDSLAKETKKQVVGRGLEHLLLYEKVADLRRYLCWGWNERSKHPDSVERILEDDLTVRGLAEMFSQQQLIEKLAMQPLKEEWLLDGLAANLGRPLADLKYWFMPGSPKFAALLETLEDEDLRWKFEFLTSLPPRAVRDEVGPTYRLVNGLLRHPSLYARCSGPPSFDLSAHLNGGGILILEGGGKVADEVLRAYFIAVINSVVMHCRNRATCPVLLVVDEGANL